MSMSASAAHAGAVQQDCQTAVNKFCNGLGTGSDPAPGADRAKGGAPAQASQFIDTWVQEPSCAAAVVAGEFSDDFTCNAFVFQCYKPRELGGDGRRHSDHTPVRGEAALRGNG